MDQQSKSLRIAVIGAGIVGAAATWELVKDGHDVTLIEPGQPGGPQAASYGNGAWLSPASVVPMSMPGLWCKVPGYLLDRGGALTIHWTMLPRLTPWLLRFLVAGATVAKVERTARALSSLLHDAPDRHAALAAEIGQPDLIRRAGLLYVYPDRKAFAAEALAWRLRRENGVRWIELDSEELRQREPALDRRYTFGAFVEAGAHCTDPGAYVAAVVAHGLGNGAKLRRAAAQGFAIEDGRLRAVVTSDGMIACERAVICAGIHSKTLARAAGDRIPLESERGYHCVIANPAVELRTPIMPSDGRMANTTTRAGLRISGQVELASVDAEPNWRRADILLRQAKATYPALAQRQDLKIDRWIGHRPSTTDGLPVIGRAAATSDIIHAFGHGHIGLAAGPITGRTVADIISGRAPSVDLGPFASSRFS
jgi:D-amino-acid dehydrogenase